MPKNTHSLASAAQLWRANQCGLLALLDEPAEPLERTEMKEVLGEAARQGLWQPATRGERGDVRWEDSVGS
jgi:hypothetical protein